MRVTQSMLSNNLLNNLSNSYKKLSTYQNQLDTGSKINRPSDDPVVATKGMGYRTTLGKINQFTANANEATNWLDTTDDALGQVGDALNRVKELVTQASTDSLTSEDRNKISSEIKQIRLQIQDLGNTQIGDKYLFNGTKTSQPLFDSNGNLTTNTSNASVNIEIFDGVTIDVNSASAQLFQNIDTAMSNLSDALDNPATTSDQIGAFLTTTSSLQDDVLSSRADVGARQNRLDMMSNRLSAQEIISTNQLSKNEDVEYEKVITQYMTQQSLHNAALSVGSSIIQSTLVDFMK
ncbi:flagellar hook-associated protein FlgL [Rummeliibacillus pycnus]|uniref:flagellar hook-associated protein FlgL n=1 Tax=Rummeliibacillus pycnus TaxID=101070 RepID=UPI000C9A90E8|nr:flagellar hook-associated protein FlgL [Rummeliibacillus pycnus]